MANQLAQLAEPGVQIIQKFATPTPVVLKPTLVPCVVGPAFEVINVLNTDGTINSGAKWGAYEQTALALAESAYPNPRGNIDELDVLEDTVAPYMLNGGVLSALSLLTGSASGFLCTHHGASAASITSAAVGSGFAGLGGKVLVLAIDQPADGDTTEDIAITFVASGVLQAADVASQINTAVGLTVATVVGTGTGAQVRITSPVFGALSSITVRKGASANSTLALGIKTSDSSAIEERVEGSGYRMQNQNNNTTQSPWVEFYIGAYLQNNVSTAWDAKAGLVNVVTKTFVSASAAVTTFGAGTSGPNIIPMLAGDLFYTDGIKLGGAEIMRVEPTRFKLGTINTLLSTADANGNYISKVYDPVSLGIIFDAAPVGPTYAYYKAQGLNWKNVAPTSATLTSTTGNQAAAATFGSVVGTNVLTAAAVTGLNLQYVSLVNGESYEGTITFTTGPVTAAQLATAINSFVSGSVTGIPGVVASDDGTGHIKLACISSGAANSITIKAASTFNTVAGFSTSVDSTLAGVDASWTGLLGTTLYFQLDNNPHVYAIGFSSNSILDTVADINRIVGATVASTDVSGRKLVLTSPLKGLASAVTVIVPSPTSAETIIGIAAGATAVAGTGRPYPDAYMDDATVLHINAEIIRDLVTGYPLDQLFTNGVLYIQFKALRKDVSPLAAVAGVLRISDVKTLTTVLSPLDESNPLGLGMFLMMLNAPTFECKGLGVDAIDDTLDGTGDAWARAAAMLEAEEVYALAPLTQNMVYQSLWITHATVMSEPENSGERIVLINKLIPTRANPTVVASGANSNSTSTSNQMLVDSNPAAGLVTAGINPAMVIPESAGVYMQFELNGKQVNYSVQSVTGALVNFRTTFSDPTTNVDGFYATATLSSSVIDAAYSVNVRGAQLVIPGTNPALPDYNAIADAVAGANSTIANRRVYSVFPDTIKTTIAGIDQVLPGYYACACIAGMVASQPPQQPFTNFPMAGIDGVVGTEKFTKAQLNIMAGGGTYILMQDAIGAPITCRMQVSTDLTSIETRELSITKVVDFTAKVLRLSLRKFIGSHVINDGLMDALGTTVHAVLTFLEASGVLNGSNLNNIAQDETNLDTVLIDVTLDVPFPCNYLRLTLVV